MKLIVTVSEIKNTLSDKHGVNMEDIEIETISNQAETCRAFLRCIQEETIRTNKIPFIKAVRTVSGLGLREAKDLVEEFAPYQSL